MNEKQYLNKIDKIRKDIRDHNLINVMEQLNEIAMFSPVRLKWIIAKAEAMLALEYPMDEIYALMRDKGWESYYYPDILDYFQLYSRMAEICHDADDVYRFQIICARIDGSQCLFEAYQALNNKRNTFFESEQAKGLLELLCAYYHLNDQIMYFMIYYYMLHHNYPLYERAEYIEFSNSGFLKEVIFNHKEVFVILVEDTAETAENCRVLEKLMQYYEKKVYWITKPVVIEVETAISLEDTVLISMENMDKQGNTIILHPVELVKAGEILGDNRDYLIKILCGNIDGKHLSVVFTSGCLMDELCRQPVILKNMQRLSDLRSPCSENDMAFGWCGSSLAYLDLIHCIDTKKELEKESEFEFSIVIPARNSAESLRYTLLTCLEQRFQGSYEIVLSDNSSSGSHEVYDLFQELNSPKIRYLRTPREYNLSKSFEFAFLQARGDFIFAIGSDDGIMPWTLDILAQIRFQFPEEKLLCWDRGFYAWPGFNNGQQNQFVIPRKYRRGEVRVYSCNAREELKKALNYPEYLYILPTLYINSGFQRSYLKKLLQITGSLWDGVSQDMYMAAANCIVQKHFLRVNYPLAIAGMTGKSEGARGAKPRETVKEEREFREEILKTGNIAGFTMSAIERFCPIIAKDTTLFYNSILRIASKGLLCGEDLEEILDWKKMFREVVKGIPVQDIQFDQLLHQCRYVASLHGSEFLRWFDQELYHKKLFPVNYKKVQIQRTKENPAYKEGELDGGGYCCDASQYGVTNIYEAVLLFERLTGL